MVGLNYLPSTGQVTNVSEGGQAARAGVKVGWSSWELKIDPKKVKEENEHVLEEDMSQTKCQESSKRMTHAKR